ncbi:lysozyme [Ephemerocybe angulata]|uniref:Lysozyme n=1 Tax=Ephemerocybe angulata TaxID=980116 RepID=A0A8H6I784_9AGAR|nr:lysozyme [Tulosesus angulatus]
MRSFIITALVCLPLLTNAALNGPCTANGVPGACLATSTCSGGGGTSVSGFCPNDPADVKCCTKTCGSGGQCRIASTCTTGNTQSGLCPGPSDFKCCLPASGCTAPSVNTATIALIKKSEGFVSKPAPDPIGLPTVGYGHLCQTSGCSEVPYSFPLTESTATSLLHSDLVSFQNCIARDIVDSVRLNDNQYGALVSWAFNVGCANAASSTLITRLNNGETPNTVASEELPKWNKAGGAVLPGLVTRRANEVALFKTASSVIAHPPPC